MFRILEKKIRNIYLKYGIYISNFDSPGKKKIKLEPSSSNLCFSLDPHSPSQPLPLIAPPLYFTSHLSLSPPTPKPRSSCRRARLRWSSPSLRRRNCHREAHLGAHLHPLENPNLLPEARHGWSQGEGGSFGTFVAKSTSSRDKRTEGELETGLSRLLSVRVIRPAQVMHTWLSNCRAVVWNKERLLCYTFFFCCVDLVTTIV